MATTNEKVSKFLSAITRYAEQQKHTILDEIEEYKKTELDRMESEALRSAYQMIQKETAEMRASINREMSGREMAKRRDLLAKRREITEKVFDRARSELISFTDSDRYPEYMERAVREISEILTGEDTVLYVRQADISMSERLKCSFGRPCEIEADDTIMIGGVRGINVSMGLAANNTLDEKLYEQRDWFALNSGLSVSVSANEAGHMGDE